jgi:pimeloyl-ACP methyl ester carboxylesterase
MDALGEDLSAFRQFRTPTLLLRGSESPKYPFQSTTRALQQTLPYVVVSTLHGQSHMAMRLAPQLVAERIAQFVAE